MEIKLGKNIKELRKNSGCTQEDLAQAVGVSSQAVSRWESGIGYPDIALLPVIAEFFDVTLDELMCDSNLTRERIREKYHNLFLTDSDPKERLALARRLAKWDANAYICELLQQNSKVTEEVRTLSKEYLKTASGYGQTLVLNELIRLEDEDKVGIWLDYLPYDTPRTQALMERYMDSPHGNPEKYTKAMQDTLHNSIWDIYMCLCEYGRSTKEGLEYLLELFAFTAPDSHDAFCENRIYILHRLAQLAFSEGEKEKGYTYLDEMEALCLWLFSHHQDDEIPFSHPLLSGKTVQAKILQAHIVMIIYYGRRQGGESFGEAIESEERFKSIMERMEELCRQANQAIFMNSNE